MALCAGFGRSLINPPLDIPSGMWMAQKHVRGSGLDMDFCVTALVVSDGDASAALIDFDLCFLTDRQASCIRDMVAEATGIPANRVLPFCSHTHAGPVTMDSYSGEGEDRVRSYVQALPHWAAAAAVTAQRNLAPVRTGGGVGRSGIGVNRDLRIPDGRIIVGSNPDGFCDKEVVVLRFDSLNGSPVGSIVNYGCHPTVLGPGNTLISPDYPGSVRRIVEQITGAPCMFLQGAAGNVGPVVTFVDEAVEARRLGTILGLEAARVCLEIDTRPVRREFAGVIASGAPLARYEEAPVETAAPVLKFASEPVQLPVRSRFSPVYEDAPAQLEQWQARLRDLEQSGSDPEGRAVALQQVTRLRLRADRLARYRSVASLPVETAALRLGSTAIVAIGGEPYSEIGAAVKAGSPFPGRTVFAGYVGGDMMYIPAADAFAHDPPPMQVDNCPYTPEAAAISTSHMLGLLRRLA